MALKIVTDSASDLRPDFAKDLGIQIVPLTVVIGNQTWPETELSINEYWNLVDEATHQDPPTYPQTSQPTRHSFEQVFEKLTEAGHEVLCITLTSKHSGTYETASAVVQEFRNRVAVFDSQFLSWGEGFIAMEAAKAAKEGQPLEQVLHMLEDMRQRTHAVVVLNTLEFLKKVGRADRVIGALESLTSFLNLKIIVNFINGNIKPLGTGRTYKKALANIISRAADLSPLEKLAVAHTREPEKAQEVATRLRELTGFTGKIPVQETGVVLASHAGPNAIAIIAISEN